MARRSCTDRTDRRARLAAKRACMEGVAHEINGRRYAATHVVVLTEDDGSETEIAFSPYTALAVVGSHAALDGTQQGVETERVMAALAFETGGIADLAGGPADLDEFIECAERLVEAGLFGLDDRGVGYLNAIADLVV